MREALKGAKRPQLLCGDPVTAGLRLAAPFKLLARSLGAAAEYSINQILGGWPGPYGAGAMPLATKNASRPSAPLTLTLQGQLRMCHKLASISNNYFTSSRCYSDNRFDRNWHEYCRLPRYLDY